MNPIAGIENIKYNNHIIDYNTNEGSPMISKTLFDLKFDDLKNNYIIDDNNSVYAFIKANENIFTILEEVKPSLRRYFSNEKYYLEVQCYPEIYRNELALVIMTDSNANPDEITKKFLKVNSEINKSKIKLGLLGKFFITLG